MIDKLKLIFIILFFLSLLGMGVSLNFSKTISQEENRTLLTWQDLKKDKSIAQLDKFVMDRFAFREHFIKFNRKINQLFPARLTNFASQHIIQGREGHNFLNNYNVLYRNLSSIQSYQNKRVLTEQQENNIVKNLQEMYQWCQENNIKMYVLFPPDNMRSCDQFVPSYILRKNQKSPVQSLSEKIPPEINVVEIEDHLKQVAQQTDDLICYKTDSHWSEFAAFIAYQKLAQKIQQDFPDLYIAQESDFYVSKIYTPYLFLNTMLGRSPFLEGGSVTLVWDDEAKKTLYKHYTPKIPFYSHISSHFKYESTQPNGHYNAYIISDSFGLNTLSFFSVSFKEVFAWNFNHSGGIFFNDRKKEMIENKTDVLILLVSDLKLRNLLRIYK